MRRLVVAFGLLMPVSGTASAQVKESSDPVLQASCQAAAQQVGVPSTLRSGLAGLKFCGVSGPPIVAGIWPGFTADDTTLSGLVATSRFLRDNRVSSAVRGTALDASKPRRLRLAALRVLVNYFDSTQVTLAGQLEQAVAGTAPGLYGETGFGPTLTTAPLGPTAPVEIGNTLAQLAATAADPSVKAAARFVRGELYYRRPAATPLLSGALVLSYSCGNKFRVRNSGDIEVQVTYSVVGFSESGSVPVLGPASGQTFRDSFFATKNAGSVQLIYNGQVIQTKENLGTACG